MQFTSKAVLITGAASGIGAATALQFAKLGAALALVDCNQERLKDIAQSCNTKYGLSTKKPVTLISDLASERDVSFAAVYAVSSMQRLDVLVNAAGIFDYGSIEKTSLQQFDRIMTTNVRSIYQMIMLSLPTLLRCKGNIVNVCDVTGLRSFPNSLAYNISKSAIDQLTRCIALELGSKGVRCNSVNPGLIDTNLYRSAGMDQHTYGEFLYRARYMHALKRYGEPDEVANAIVFLASNLASFITGVNLPVDGGKRVMCPS